MRTAHRKKKEKLMLSIFEQLRDGKVTSKRMTWQMMYRCRMEVRGQRRGPTLSSKEAMRRMWPACCGLVEEWHVPEEGTTKVTDVRFL